MQFDTQAYIQQKGILKSLEMFVDLLLHWGKVHNLSGAKEKDSIWKQIKDSLLPISFLQDFRTCIDIGSGAGFPLLF